MIGKTLTDAQRAALASRLRRDRDTVADQIPRRPAGLAELPLSYGQEQLWFIDRFAPGLPTYNIPHALRLAGPLDEAALDRALAGLVARHESLRTRLVTGSSGRPVQVIEPPGEISPERVDLSGLAPAPRQEELLRFIHAEAMRSIDLSAGPLLRTWLIGLDPAEHILLIVVHHTVYDGWSAGVLVRDLAALYAAAVSGEPATLAEALPELPVQFADYALWEHDRLRGPRLAELEDYWRKTMDGFETIQFPTDRPRPVLDNFDGGLEKHMSGRELLDGLRELSRREGTTLFVTLMAGLQAVLYRYTGQADLVVGTASASRGRAELASLIGFLVNTLPIRGDLSGDPSFADLMAQLKTVTIGAYAHQDLPFGKLVDTLKVERDLSRAPVFQIAMSLSEPDRDPVPAAGLGISLTDLIIGFDAAKSDLILLAEPRDAGLWIECSYKTALFDTTTVRRLLGHLEVLLAGTVADPSARLSELPLLTEAERYRELAEWNDTAAELPVTCIHEGFEARVAAAPLAPAAQYESEAWSYAELNTEANRIARRLRELGVGPEVLVGVCMRPGLIRLAALLGVWKAGGGYVPLDPELPADRLNFMIIDAATPLILTDAASRTSIPASVPGDTTVVDLDAERDRIATLDGTDLAGTGATPASVAYVIYTSGSTGQPKGVVVEHRQAINFLHAMTRHWHIGPGAAVLSFAAFTFDVSVMDMFMPLLGGAKVVFAPAATLHSPPRLAALIRDAGISFACLPPAVLSLLTGEDFPDLHTLLSAGEELTTELLRAWLRPGLEIYNGYGPTECSIGSTFMSLDPDSPLPPPIGRPKPNYQAYVLDAHLNPVPVGVTGELHIGGAGVARGYLSRPELTRERFIPDPFSDDPGARLYKTGDLARRRPDGLIMFAGRIDDQVKIRGLRVELGEVEAALTSHPAVAQAVVTVTPDGAGVPQLAGYLRPADAGPPDLGDLRQHLAGRLPGYMIPTYLTVLEQIPLTPNGKVDKAALPPPQAAAQAGGQEPPRTALEAVLTDLQAKVLGTGQAGATDGFFDAGGNSLQAMQLITEVRGTLAVDLDVTAVFLAPAPRQLAALLVAEHGFADSDLDEIGV
ncbi:MAG: non-ribosomal peptide synthetase [Streptosporangiaceae bacterium]